jgi:peptide deformylase
MANNNNKAQTSNLNNPKVIILGVDASTCNGGSLSIPATYFICPRRGSAHVYETMHVCMMPKPCN